MSWETASDTSKHCCGHSGRAGSHLHPSSDPRPGGAQTPMGQAGAEPTTVAGRPWAWRLGPALSSHIYPSLQLPAVSQSQWCQALICTGICSFKYFCLHIYPLFIYLSERQRERESSRLLGHSTDACNGPGLGLTPGLGTQSCSPTWVAGAQHLEPSPLPLSPH